MITFSITNRRVGCYFLPTLYTILKGCTSYSNHRLKVFYFLPDCFGKYMTNQNGTYGN